MANPFFKALGAQQKAQSGNPMMNFTHGINPERKYIP